MAYLLRLAMLTFMALSVSSGSTPLDFTAEQINPVIYSFQRDHYCTPYVLPNAGNEKPRFIGLAPDDAGTGRSGVPLKIRPAARNALGTKQGLTEMWVSEPGHCDLSKQQDTFYDSVWRDAVRLETIINYKAYFGPDIAGRIDLADFAIDDGVVKKQMVNVLTTDTTNTFGAQNDDILWWALAFLRAYEYDPSHTAYLKAAEAVFTRISHTPEQGVCGGGITWGSGTGYKNAITNALYLRLAVRLAETAPLHSKRSRRYLATAITEADWLIDRSGLWVSGGLLADGVHFKGNDCSKEPESTIWTYSQGVAIAGLAQLTLLTSNKKYADRAQSLLMRTLDSSRIPQLVNSEGILAEPSTSATAANEDAQTFKGIFVRNVGYAIAYFRKADPRRYAPAVECGRSFLITNANAVWRARRVRGDNLEFPFEWRDAGSHASGPVNMRTTAAAIDLFNAAWSVKNLE